MGFPCTSAAESAQGPDQDEDFEPQLTLADIDPEIAAMFTEEATELLDDAERAIFKRRWEAATGETLD